MANPSERTPFKVLNKSFSWASAETNPEVRRAFEQAGFVAQLDYGSSAIDYLDAFTQAVSVAQDIPDPNFQFDFQIRNSRVLFDQEHEPHLGDTTTIHVLPSSSSGSVRVEDVKVFVQIMKDRYETVHGR